MSDQAEPTTTPESGPENSAFERVPEPLRSAIEAQGFTALTSVQLAALDALDANRDLRISSQTGSGKTVALGLAMAAELVKESDARTGPTALVIVPTRELASQVHKELSWLYAGVRHARIDSVTGGTHVGQERRRLARGPRVLVGTPGRLCDHIRSGALDCSSVKQLVLDEADQMLDMGFRDELDTILGEMPEERRTHMLSATFPDAVRRLTERYQTDPLQIEGTQLGRANEDIAHVGHVVRPRDFYGTIVNLLLLAGDQRTLVFVATRADTGTLAEKLASDGFTAMPLSGDLAQAQRTRTLNAFRAGRVAVLVATDVAARGIDVPEVSLVIQADLPMDAEVYTHRSGRTGRAGRKGRSVVLATPNGERRARRILNDANVSAQWQLVPSAPDVDRALTKRARRRVKRTIEDSVDTLTEAELELARDLLKDREPEQVVATLLANLPSGRVRDPFDVETPMPRSVGKSPRARKQNSGDADEFTRFRINWGFKNGANPRRILATICRRGNVTSDVIGAIDIDAYSATFGVANASAPDFEARASQRDKRDPHRRIERARGDQSRGDRGRPRHKRAFRDHAG